MSFRPIKISFYCYDMYIVITQEELEHILIAVISSTSVLTWIPNPLCQNLGKVPFWIGTIYTKPRK